MHTNDLSLENRLKLRDTLSLLEEVAAKTKPDEVLQVVHDRFSATDPMTRSGLDFQMHNYALSNVRYQTADWPDRNDLVENLKLVNAGVRDRTPSNEDLRFLAALSVIAARDPRFIGAHCVEETEATRKTEVRKAVDARMKAEYDAILKRYADGKITTAQFQAEHSQHALLTAALDAREWLYRSEQGVEQRPATRVTDVKARERAQAILEFLDEHADTIESIPARLEANKVQASLRTSLGESRDPHSVISVDGHEVANAPVHPLVVEDVATAVNQVQQPRSLEE